MIPFWKKIRQASRPHCTALIVAAGTSQRMGSGNKLFLSLEGMPVLARTLTAFEFAERVDEIVIAAREEDILEISQLCKTYGIRKCVKVVRGGESRVHSAYAAALESSPKTELLAVHDGARPLVRPDLIDRVAAAAARCGGAAPAVPLKDTIKSCREDGGVEETLDRERLRAIQTPQVFSASLLKAALQSALDAECPVTDDAAAVERLGKVVFLVEGDEENLKITTPLDMVLAEAILRFREEQR